MQGLLEAKLKRMAVSGMLDTGETGGKVLLRVLWGSGGFLLRKFRQAFRFEVLPATPSPPRSKWVIGLSVVLGVVLFLASLMYYYYRCGCSTAKSKRRIPVEHV